MKKYLLLFVAALTLVSCDITDDGPRIGYDFSKVTATDLPESFELGKTYQIEVTYQLPDACHSPAGVEAKRGAFTGEERRDIYVAGVASYDANVTTCDEEADDEDLSKKARFSLTIDENQPYTFYLWVGVSSTFENIYTTVEVPVVDPNEDDNDA